MTGAGYKYQLDDLKRLAFGLNGECLDDCYKGVLAKYRWKCNTCSHEWIGSAAPLLYKSRFCPNCSKVAAGLKRRSVSVEIAALLAGQRGGHFASTEMGSTKDKYKWRCAEGHEWLASYDKVKQGRWCPSCGREKVRTAASYSLDDIQKIAQSFGGRLLDAAYKGIDKYHNFLCANGHEFRKLPSQLTKSSPLARSWCQKCSKSMNISEVICRSILETAYQKSFFSQYPGDWLRNERGRKMQLDGYCPDINLAFEYQGQQHSHHVGKFGVDQNLSQRQRDDFLKLRLCKEHQVRLVQIPHFPTVNLSLEEIVSHIGNSFMQSGINLPPLNLEELERSIALSLSEPLKRLQLLAAERNGELLSKIYLGMASKYNWRCSSGHEWSAQAASINSGTWCPECAGKTHGNIEQMRVLAAKHGGKCLSNDYLNSKRHLKWQCGDCGHTWLALPGNIHKGHWCPKCAELKPLEEARMRLTALCNGQQINVVSKYLGSKGPIAIECSKGHLTKYSAADYLRRMLVKGNWTCPACSD